MPTLSNPRVLWIDDELSVLKYSSEYLTSKGVQLEIAVDARRGVALASQSRFDLIVLDLRLQGAWGLDVLRDLRAVGVTSQVMILTAYGEVDSALQAGLLGAVAYERKPLVGPKLLAAILKAVAFDRRSPQLTPRPSSDFVFPVQSMEVVRRILDAGGSGLDRDWLATSLARALADSDRTFFEFLAVSTGLRFMNENPAYTLSALVPKINHVLDTTAALRWDHLDDRIRMVVTRIENAGALWRELAASSVAAAVGISGTTLWRLLQVPLGLTFPALIRAIVMRRAIPELAENQNHIRQIAFRCGYDHHSGFDRDFKEFLGVSPRQFRSILHLAGCAGAP